VRLWSSRAVSSVIGNILLVATVVILAATISVFALGFTEETTDAGPVVGQSSGELVRDIAGVMTRPFDSHTSQVTV
jgi:FlaG/FlaF family flagellin (archaellin)